MDGELAADGGREPMDRGGELALVTSRVGRKPGRVTRPGCAVYSRSLFRPQITELAQWPRASGFDAPALFVGFLAVEARGFQRDPARGNPCREDRSGNMGRILFLVCQHRHRVFGSGDTMREGCGAEGRFAGLEKDRVTAIRDSSRVATAGLHALQAAVVHGGLVRARPADL